MNKHTTSAAASKSPTAFTMHLAAYHAACSIYDAHCAQFEPAEDADPDIWAAYEASYAALVDAMYDTGVAALLIAATCAEDSNEKLKIFEALELGIAGQPEAYTAVMEAFASDLVAPTGEAI